ncbi:putative NRPS-like protein biosynthetic cluster [Aspergillus brasiliensis]|uniref:NRPS-like protein biosynthetic cluster n=1 Tax=Aspergillus brasiliensis TaxID=319629 RepID=A0A9W6DNY0_9EURO|nr:putative NRPS-like protein biosynthetic cluster [Aspergillus brasiliensis]GKZ45371.1 putative NRPS-like protein biosynthetic cluster [Aspergillus brasiliensis]
MAEISEIDTGPLANDHPSVFWHIEQGLRRGPDNAAVVCMHQPWDHLVDIVPIGEAPAKNPLGNPAENLADHHPCLTLSYRQIHGAALALAAGLQARGVRDGTRLLTLIPNGGEYAIILWACALLRLTLSSLEVSLLDDQSQLPILKDLQPGVVITPNGHGADIIDQWIQPPPLHVSLSPLGNAHHDGCVSLSQLIALGHAVLPSENRLLKLARQYDPDRIHSILFTSGTSGRPKGCPQRVAALTHVLEHLSWLITPDNASSVLQQAHNSRAIAPAHTLQTWRQGGAVIMAEQSFAVTDTLTALRDHDVTFLVLSPAMVHALARELDGQLRLTDSVRTVHLGGDAITHDVLRTCEGLFPKARVCISHGMTEGLGFFEWPFTKADKEIPLFGEICPTGAVAAGTRLRIWDPERRTVVLRGQPGVLQVQCESVISDYLVGGGDDAFHVEDDARWFVTGDVAVMDVSGLVFILGRIKDAIRRGGKTIMPAAVESCLEKYTEGQAAVVAYPAIDPRPIAVLSGMTDRAEDQIRAHVVDILGQDCLLDRVLSLQQIGLSAFPVNATHKVVRAEVQQAVAKYLSLPEQIL